MRRIQALIAMVLLGSLVPIFYSFINLLMPHTHRALQEDISANPIVTANGINTIPQLHSVSAVSAVSLPDVQNGIETDFVSASLRQAIPQNTAYWNRILHSRLRHLDQGKYLAEHNKVNREVNLELLKMNIHDFSSYPELHQNFLLGMEFRDPLILIDQPTKCSSGEGGGQTFLLFAIKSTPRNFEQRQVVRETWGREGLYQGGLRVRTVFLLGSSLADDPNLEQLLSFEAQHFSDLLQWDFHDSFFNLTLKEHMFYRWALKHCPHVSFIFKGDDDIFANTQATLNYLQSLESAKALKIYVGQVISTASPLRDPKSKYYVPLTFYDGPYPAYAGGGGYLFSGALLQPLHSISQFIPFFPIDDVYTGMCFQALGISPETHTGFQTFDIQKQDRANVCAHKDLLLVHQRSPQQIKRLWRGMHSPLLTC